MAKELYKTKIGDEKYSFSVGNYGQERDLICTEPERQIFEIVLEMAGELLLDPEVLRLARVSDNYVSIVMDSTKGYGAMDVARFKYTNRAKWIKYGPRFKKTDIEVPDDVREYPEELVAAYRANEPYL